MPQIALADISSYGSIDGTTLTAAYQQVKNFNDNVLVVHVFNNCDETVIISFDGGTTDNFKVPAFHSFTVDFQTSGLRADSPDVQVKHDGVVPGQGFVSVTGMAPNIGVNL